MYETLRTYLSGLVGRGISASRSPEMHEREAAALGLTLVYRRIDFDQLNYSDDQLDGTLRWLETIGFDGVNLTHPFKQRVLESLDSVAPDAAALGAVNTVVFRDGTRRGYNTDWSGFRASLQRGLPGAALHEVAQIGCGGAGSAIAYALSSMGAQRVKAFDSDRTKALEMAERIGPHFPKTAIEVCRDAKTAMDGADGVVQASPIGMAAHPGVPFDPTYLREGMWVADIVYFPTETALLAAARACGCRTLSGGGMAVHQAADAFQLITGVEPSVERMLQTF
jgi:shikimate dehydrogenase